MDSIDTDHNQFGEWAEPEGGHHIVAALNEHGPYVGAEPVATSPVPSTVLAPAAPTPTAVNRAVVFLGTHKEVIIMAVVAGLAVGFWSWWLAKHAGATIVAKHAALGAAGAAAL